ESDAVVGGAAVDDRAADRVTDDVDLHVAQARDVYGTGEVGARVRVPHRAVLLDVRGRARLQSRDAQEWNLAVGVEPADADDVELENAGRRVGDRDHDGRRTGPRVHVGCGVGDAELHQAAGIGERGLEVAAARGRRGECVR